MTLSDYYLPGSQGGGPIRALANQARALRNVVRFAIVTSDRDLGSKEPYSGVQFDRWQRLEGAAIFYGTARTLTFFGIATIARARGVDCYYINSLFSRTSLRLLFLRAAGFIPKRQLVIAPRGELSPGALRTRRGRKRLALSIGRLLGFYHGAIWQASSEIEADHIGAHFGKYAANATHVTREFVEVRDQPGRSPKRPGIARLVFLSRIAPKKNLDGALKMASRISRGRVELDVYGPIDDEAYWTRCKTRAGELPSNVSFQYHGPVNHSDVTDILASADALVLPTHGENFGHVIYEALVAGCPVLIGTDTPWKRVDERRAAAGAGATVRPEDIDSGTDFLQRIVDMDEEEHSRWRVQAHEVAAESVELETATTAARDLFFAAAGRSSA